MGSNVNHNSFNALRTDNSSYYKHNSISDFSFVGDNEYTIEIFLYYKSGATRSVLYGQEGVFELGIDNGYIYITSPDFANFNTRSVNINLMEQSNNYVAIRYKEGKIELFLQGFKVAEYSATPANYNTAADYIIGKGAMGYISTIRMFSKALTDAQILTDNVCELEKLEGCVSWINCENRQIEDNSDSKLNIYLVGDLDTYVVNIAPSSEMSGHGCATVSSKIPENTKSYTFMTKVYPYYNSHDEMCIFSNFTDANGYEVALKVREDSKYQIIFRAKNIELISEEIVEGNQWLDIAFTYSENNICLYINGVKDKEVLALNLELKGQANVLIGTSYLKNRVDYSRGYSGLIAYLAEFNAAITPEQINGYMSTPPYFLDKDILSLMMLDLQEPQEIISGEYIFKSGDFNFCFAESTSPHDAATGVDYYFPDKEDPMWATLTEEQKWKLEYYCLSQGLVLLQSLGLNIENQESELKRPAQYCTTYLVGAGVLEQEFESVPSNQNLFASLAGGVMIAAGACLLWNIRTYIIPTIRGYRFLANGVTGFITMLFGAAGGGAEITVLAAAMGTLLISGGLAIIITQFTSRPEPDNPVITLETLRINHDNGNSSKGSIHCRVNNDNSIPETFTDQGSLNMYGVLVPAKLGDYMDMDITLKNHSDKEVSGVLNGDELNAIETIFGNIHSCSTITIPANETITTTISIPISDRIWKSVIRLRKMTAQFNWTFGANFIKNTSSIIYTLLDTPKTPWIYSGQYSATQVNYVWTDLLDICVDAYTKYQSSAVVHNDASHLSAYTENLNKGGQFTYDRERGAPFYTTSQCAIKLTKYVADYNNKSASKLNCTDCASIVSISGLATGITCCLGLIESSEIASGLELNPLIGIGSTDWGAPFDSGSYYFSFHFMAFLGLSSSLDKDSHLFDACLQIDGGDYPCAEKIIQTYTREAILPMNYLYSETDINKTINVPTDSPYTKSFYRQRLLRDGSSCDVLDGYNILSITSDMDMLNLELSDPHIKLFKKRLGIDNNTIPPFSCENNCLDEMCFVPPNNFGNWLSIFEFGREKEWSLRYKEKDYELQIFVALDHEEAYDYMLNSMSMITSMELRKTDLTEFSFAINDTLTLFVKNRYAIRVIGDSGCEEVSIEIINNLS